jgi:CrcB protein
LITGLALGHDEALLAGTAAVGSYTTFSTWMLETQRLTEERQHGKAAVNVIASLAAGVAAAALGRLLGQLIGLHP